MLANKVPVSYRSHHGRHFHKLGGTSTLAVFASEPRTAMLKPLVLGALALLTVVADPAAAQEEAPRRIVVTGTGEARARPNIAVISAGVVVQSETASAALAENTRAMEAVLRQLSTAGVAEEDVQTSQFSVMPLYERQPPERESTAPPRIIGYQVSNQVTARVREIDRLGAVLDALVSAGATNIDGPWFDISDPAQVLGEARDAAVADALARARRYAAAARVELGEIISIEETGTFAPPPRPMMRAEAMAADVPIAPGQTELSASVTVTFAIE
jgi:uncharacterized protein